MTNDDKRHLRTTANEDPQNRLSRLCCAGCVLMTLMGAAACFSVARRSGPNLDEPAHLTAGYLYLETRDFRIYHVNPPLPRLLFALPGYLWYQPKLEIPPETLPSVRQEFLIGEDYVAGMPADQFCAELTLARCVSILASILTIWLVIICIDGTWWIRMLIQGVWWTSPLVLHYSATLTTDIWAALGVAFVFWRALRFMSDRTLKNCVLLGVGAGFGILCKFSVGPPALAAILLAAFWNPSWSWLSMKRFVLLTGMMGMVALATINASYLFRGTGKPIQDYAFVSEALRDDRIGTNRFEGTLLGAMPVPLPADLVLGCDQQISDFEVGKRSFLYGTWQTRGWWYYYFAAFIVKEPIGTIAIATIGVIGLLFRDRKASSSNSAKAIRVLVSVMMLVTLIGLCKADGFSRYLRYAILFYPLICLAVARIPRVVGPRWRVPMIAAVGVFVLAALGEQGLAWPYPHHYFNVAVGGPTQGHRYLRHANLGWGEDIWELRQFASELPEKQSISLCSTTTGFRSLIGRDVTMIASAAEIESKQCEVVIVSQDRYYANRGFEAYPVDRIGANHFVLIRPTESE